MIKGATILSKLGAKESKFIRQCAKRYTFQQTYSVTFKKWKQDKAKRQIMLKVKRSKLWPAQINQVVNIMWVLEKKYDAPIENIVTYAIVLWETYDEDIHDYRHYKGLNIKEIGKLSPQKALKEQIARGFKKINGYEGFKRNWDHVQSVVDKDYFYPENFPGTSSQIQECHSNKRDLPIGYAAVGAIGVRGHTRVYKGVFKPQ